MKRSLALLYGVVAYLLFFATFLYAIAFLGNVLVPKTVDRGQLSPPATAIIIDLLLLSAFALQHSIMARHGFKKAWTRLISTSDKVAVGSSRMSTFASRTRPRAISKSCCSASDNVSTGRSRATPPSPANMRTLSACLRRRR